jgi:SprT protein
MNISDIKKAVDSKIRDGIAKVEKKYGRRFPVPKITYDLTGQVAGRAYGRSLIRLNLPLLIHNFEDAIENTVLHELAHCIVSQVHPGAQAHGLEFKSMCWTLGIKNDTCHNYDTSVSSKLAHFKYTCGCQEYNLTSIIHNKIQAGQTRRCRKCKGILRRVEAGTEVKKGLRTYNPVREL